VSAPPPGVVIRPERPGDEAAIHALTDAAFRNVDDESAIIDRLRGGDRWIPDLSLVAVASDGTIVGHCVTSIGDLVADDGTTTPILALGPISVAPDRQKEGIGGALMHATIGTATRLGWPVIVLLGHATYYPRFGFEPARALGIEPQHPWPDANWLAVRLSGWTPDLRGTMRFPPAFGID
jgi:putative acetyltransferase